MSHSALSLDLAMNREVPSGYLMTENDRSVPIEMKKKMIKWVDITVYRYEGGQAENQTWFSYRKFRQVDEMGGRRIVSRGRD